MLSKSFEDTFNIARAFATRLKPGNIICLEGDLGVGKTVFVQGLARGLGINDYVSSPTFNIVNTYKANIKLHHFDAYRIADSDEMLDIGFEDYINDNAIIVIEWPSMISDIIPPEACYVKISRVDQNENYREIEFTNENFSS